MGAPFWLHGSPQEANAYLKPKGPHSSSFLKKVKCFVILLQYNLSYFSSWQTLSNLKTPAWTEQPPTDRWTSTTALHTAGVYLPCNRGLWHPGQGLHYQSPVRTFVSLVTRFQSRAKYLLWQESFVLQLLGSVLNCGHASKMPREHIS